MKRLAQRLVALQVGGHHDLAALEPGAHVAALPLVAHEQVVAQVLDAERQVPAQVVRRELEQLAVRLRAADACRPCSHTASRNDVRMMFM